ncbi:hypothetical protein T484DRAFT_1906773 [Baffinella frigidus]|nr:hypothetical protein T484DRAFT_1906773 [Cryptophyta sp. CCMP2293]
MGSREAAAAAIRAAEAGLFSGIVNSVNFSTYPAPSPKTFAREYGKNGLGWGKAPVGEKPCVTIGIVCPTSHVERVRGYIRDVFDLEVVTVSGEAFAASRVRQLHVDACANQLPDRPKTVPAGQMNMRVILARPAAQGASSSIVQSRILAARLEADPLLARSAQRAFPLGVVGEGHAVEVGAWSGVAASAAEAVDAIFPFLPLGASVRVAAFPKFAQDKLVKLLDARGVTLSPTANSVAISAVVADSGWWHLFLSRTDPSDPASAPRDADSGAASRAFFKIGEALVRCKEEGAVPGCLAIDVGAAPGGWSQNLVARGCTQVIAVDPAPLNLEPPIGEALLRHMPIMIEEAVPILLAEGRAASLSVYVCDMVYQPGTCPIGILESCIPLLVPKALCIVTLKGAAGHSAASVEIGFAAKIAAFRLLCPGAQVLHLMANRERERTLVGHLA